MKALFQAAVIAACWFCLEPGAGRADDKLPMPRILDDDGPRFSTDEFNRLLQKMRAEREALRSDWNTLVRKNSGPVRDPDEDLQRHLKLILQHLQMRQSAGAAPPAPGTALTTEPGTGPPDPGPAKAPAGGPETAAGPPSGTVDVVSQAQDLFRSRQFEDALATFKQIELRGQKSEFRAPIQYLMAMCMLHLGKNEEALPLLREVANARGDERLAGYAQWELEMLRWERNVQDKLQELRQRRESLEKK